MKSGFEKHTLRVLNHVGGFCMRALFFFSSRVCVCVFGPVTTMSQQEKDAESPPSRGRGLSFH